MTNNKLKAAIDKEGIIIFDSENGEDENFLAGTKLEKSKVTYKKGIIGMGIGYTYKF